jgi:hypothetical protein
MPGRILSDNPTSLELLAEPRAPSTWLCGFSFIQSTQVCDFDNSMAGFDSI